HLPRLLPGHGLSVTWLVTAILVSESELVVMSIVYWLTVGPVITVLRPPTYGTRAMTLVIIVWSRPAKQLLRAGPLPRASHLVMMVSTLGLPVGGRRTVDALRRL